MPLARVKKHGDVTVRVEAFAEVLFTQAGPVGRWSNRLSNSITRYARDAAPSNRRPRWAHYGAPLKTTIHSATDYDPATLRVHSVIGSNSPYGYYVDQGTGVYNGSGPYPAKVLPPSAWRSPDVYVAGMMAGRLPARQVWIRGQKGQKFLETGVRRGFAQAHLLSHNVPGLGEAADALNSFPEGLIGQVGNTPNSGMFRASLAQWKEWRREYWEARKMNDRFDRKAENARKRAETKAQKPKKKPKPKVKKIDPRKKAIEADRERFMQKVLSRYSILRGDKIGTPHFNGHQWSVVVITAAGREVTLVSSTKF